MHLTLFHAEIFVGRGGIYSYHFFWGGGNVHRKGLLGNGTCCS